MKSAKQLSASLVVILSVLASTTAVASAQTTWSCLAQEATIVGTPNDDVLQGTPGVDIIVAREGNDVIRGLDGDDIICAGKGNDVIYGGGGFDIIFGAEGDDIIYSARGSGNQFRQDSRGARIFGGAGNDTIHGSDRWDRMQGGPGRDNLYGYEGRDWMRAGPGSDQVDGGQGIDDLHGGHGNDTIGLTSGDVVRGGAGLDQCNIDVGAPQRRISCGLNTREVPPPQPEPIPFQSWTNFGLGAGTQWSGEVLGIYETDLADGYVGEPGRCYLLIFELTAVAVPESGLAWGADLIDMSLRVDGDFAYGLNNVCDGASAEAVGVNHQNDVRVPLGTSVVVYKPILVRDSTSGVIESIVIGDERLESVRDYPPIYLTSVPTA